MSINHFTIADGMRVGQKYRKTTYRTGDRVAIRGGVCNYRYVKGGVVVAKETSITIAPSSHQARPIVIELLAPIYTIEDSRGRRAKFFGDEIRGHMSAYD